MQTTSSIHTPQRGLPVGSLVQLKTTHQHWQPGSVGLCFDMTEFLGKAGVFIIFEDGECALFNVMNVPRLFDVIGFSTEHCFYRHHNYQHLKLDYDQGGFESAFKLGRSLVIESAQAA
ncbi:hypothetical protein QPK87_15300 [Kamptonema cortianum]|nr:hypothetical protein [Oscillatoria laete-virens]MDK3157929.1 hypothetical protein [Kamptonema cortianum]MDL5046057.1 hypothetical protein [Oscillatoria amoena NRMC-F 0135]MDL5052764.1 hypothetical protein [Oscillatoria laete-virens NRMC-F 0139]